MSTVEIARLIRTKNPEVNAIVTLFRKWPQPH
jgi:hypothetical protein